MCDPATPPLVSQVRLPGGSGQTNGSVDNHSKTPESVLHRDWDQQCVCGRGELGTVLPRTKALTRHCGSSPPLLPIGEQRVESGVHEGLGAQGQCRGSESPHTPPGSPPQHPARPPPSCPRSSQEAPKAWQRSELVISAQAMGFPGICGTLPETGKLHAPGSSSRAGATPTPRPHHAPGHYCPVGM